MSFADKETKIAMTIAVEHMKECILVLMKGEVKASDCSLLENVLELASVSTHKNVWVDCGHVASVSTQALRIILALSSRARSVGVNLVLCQMAPSMEKVMRESRLDTVLHIVPSIAEASRVCANNRGN